MALRDERRAHAATNAVHFGVVLVVAALLFFPFMTTDLDYLTSLTLTTIICFALWHFSPPHRYVASTLWFALIIVAYRMMFPLPLSQSLKIVAASY